MVLTRVFSVVPVTMLHVVQPQCDCYLEQKSNRFWRNALVQNRDPPHSPERNLIVTCLICNHLSLLSDHSELLVFFVKVGFFQL